MKLKTNKSSGQQGFSLVELLVVIAVIAIIAAIAIPNIANITSNATYAKSQRNAQSIASVANAAIAAGYTGADWGSKSNLVASLASGSGVSVTPAGNTNVMTFSVSELTSVEQGLTYPFLGFSSSTVISYVAAGNSSN